MKTVEKIEGLTLREKVKWIKESLQKSYDKNSADGKISFAVLDDLFKMIDSHAIMSEATIGMIETIAGKRAEAEDMVKELTKLSSSIIKGIK